MRILLAVSSLGQGGAERVATTLANAWSARGDAVTLLATYSGKGECHYRVSPAVRLVFLSHLAGCMGRSPAAYLARFRALRRLIRVARPDVIVSFLTNVNVAVVASSRGMRVPVIVCERTNPVLEDKTGWLLRILRRLTYRAAELVTVQTEAIVDPFRRVCRGVERVEVVPNPIPPELAAFASTAPRSSARKRLVAMGRLSPEKQFALLVSAFARLAEEHADWDLWIWGEGPLYPVLREQVAAAGLAGRVVFGGATREPWSELARSDVFVLSSAFEGFPNALLEAMALGLPCVAFDCPHGPREISRDGRDAVLVPTGDEGGLAEALGRVMHDAALRGELAHRAGTSVRERFALEHVLPIWDRLFVLAGHARSAR